MATQRASNNKRSPGANAHWQEISEGRAKLLNVRAEIAKRRTTLPAAVDRIGQFLAHPVFFISFLLLHLGWIIVNLPMWPWRPWDPYPFILLATLASAESLALWVLMFQQRNSRIEELREEVHLQVSLHLEREISMALRLLQEIQEGSTSWSVVSGQLRASIRRCPRPRRRRRRPRPHDRRPLRAFSKIASHCKSLHRPGPGARNRF